MTNNDSSQKKILSKTKNDSSNISCISNDVNSNKHINNKSINFSNHKKSNLNDLKKNNFINKSVEKPKVPTNRRDLYSTSKKGVNNTNNTTGKNLNSREDKFYVRNIFNNLKFNNKEYDKGLVLNNTITKVKVTSTCIATKTTKNKSEKKESEQSNFIFDTECGNNYTQKALDNAFNSNTNNLNIINSLNNSESFNFKTQESELLKPELNFIDINQSNSLKDSSKNMFNKDVTNKNTGYKNVKFENPILENNLNR